MEHAMSANRVRCIRRIYRARFLEGTIPASVGDIRIPSRNLRGGLS
jgi:hypothetical protein